MTTLLNPGESVSHTKKQRNCSITRQRLLQSAKKFRRFSTLPIVGGMNGSAQPNGSARPSLSSPQVYVVGSPNPKSPYLRIAHVSDTCDTTDNGLSATFQADVLVHSGNLWSYQFRRHFFRSTEFHSQIKAINQYFASLPHRYKILVPGPNEIFFDSESRETMQALLPNCIYLQDSQCVIEGVTFYGVPWSAGRRGTVGRGFGKSVTELKTAWSNVPDNVDVLISHSMPTNSVYDDMVMRIKPKMFLYGSRNQRSSKGDQIDESCVKFKDNIIFSNGHAGNCCKRGVFDFYTDPLLERRTSLPQVSSEVVSQAYRSLPTGRGGLLSCILS